MRAGLGAEAADLRDDFLALEEALGERAGEAAAEEESCESLTLTLTPMGPLEAKPLRPRVWAHDLGVPQALTLDAAS